MNNKFTKEDIIKKHETNVKSAFTAISLAGILGLIYVVRYFITGNFNFHFSLSFPEMMLRFGQSGEVSTAAAYSLTAVFFLVYLILVALCLKDTKYLTLSLGLYVFDFICLLFFVSLNLMQSTAYFSNDIFIEVILHCMVILFLSVGVYSRGKLKKMK